MTYSTSMTELGREIQVCVSKSDNMRITAARKLTEARRRFDAGETCGCGHWRDWVAEFVKISEREARRLLSIGRADAPEEALERLRRQARDGMRLARARDQGRPNVRPLARRRAPLHCPFPACGRQLPPRPSDCHALCETCGAPTELLAGAPDGELADPPMEPPCLTM